MNKYKRPITWQPGKAHKNSKLNWPEVWDIRDFYRDTDLTVFELAVIYKVSPATIQRVTSFKTWVKNEPERGE